MEEKLWMHPPTFSLTIVCIHSKFNIFNKAIQVFFLLDKGKIAKM